MIHILQHVCYCSIRGICHIGEWNWIPLSNLDKPCGFFFFFLEGRRNGQEKQEKITNKLLFFSPVARKRSDFNKIITFISSLLKFGKIEEHPPPPKKTHSHIIKDRLYLYSEIIHIYILKLYKYITGEIFFSLK